MKFITKKSKRVVTTLLAVVCAFSSVAAFGASAKSKQYTHTVDVGDYKGGYDGTEIYVSKTGSTCSDTFSSYPTIYNGKTSATLNARIKSGNGKLHSNWKSLTLQKNSPSYSSVIYGSLKKKGYWYLEYKRVSGGFKDAVTTIVRY